MTEEVRQWEKDQQWLLPELCSGIPQQVQVIDESACFSKKHEHAAIKLNFIKHDELFYNIQQ